MCKKTKPWVGFCYEGDYFQIFPTISWKGSCKLLGAPHNLQEFYGHTNLHLGNDAELLLNETNVQTQKKHMELLSPNEKPSDYYRIKQDICDRQMGGMSSNS